VGFENVLRDDLRGRYERDELRVFLLAVAQYSWFSLPIAMVLVSLAGGDITTASRPLMWVYAVLGMFVVLLYRKFFGFLKTFSWVRETIIILFFASFFFPLLMFVAPLAIMLIRLSRSGQED